MIGLARVAVGAMNAHRVALKDRCRIGCQCCDARAVMCEYSRSSIPTRTPTKLISFYYYCAACWATPGPSQSSPTERTGYMGLVI